MDPKKKKLYAIIIVCCIILAAGVFLWGRGGTPTLKLPANTQNSSAATQSLKVSADGSYGTPAVFPANLKIDTSVLDSTTFKTLKTYTPVANTKQDLGRDNPFNQY